MAAFVGAIAPAAQNSRTGAQSNGLTSNMTALRRYHRKAYACGVGYRTIAGALTSTTSSATLTGTGTKFTADLFVGAKLMQANGSTLLGYVSAIASDTSLTLLANAAVAQTAAAATILPRLSLMSFGDSVADKKNQFVVPTLRNVLGTQGFCGSTPYGGVGGISSTGTITQQNGTSIPWDYTYTPLGADTRLGAASSYTWGVGGAVYTANLFTVYLVAGPGQGTVTVDLQDNANTVQSTQAGIDLTKDAGGNALASPALRIVKFNLGGAPAARKIRVTTTAGTAIVPFSPSVQNTTLRGLNTVALSRGGLNHPDILSCANPGLVAAFIADQQIDFATYEMREAGIGLAANVDQTLPPIMAMLMAQWSAIDWLFYGQTPGVVDAGLVKAACPSWIENEKTRVYAVGAGYAFFDGYTPLDSYETILGMDPPYDGNHVADMFSHLLASLVLRQFGLDRFVNLPIAPAGLATPIARAAKLAASKTIDGSGTDAGYFETDTFGFDLYGRMGRWFAITDQAGNNRTLFSSPNAGYGTGILFGSSGGAWETTAGYYNARDWSLRAEGTTDMRVRWKDSGGTFKMSALAGSAVVASLPAASGFVPGTPYWASNGRRSGQGSGAGTGCQVVSDGTSWLTTYDYSVVAA